MFNKWNSFCILDYSKSALHTFVQTVMIPSHQAWKDWLIFFLLLFELIFPHFKNNIEICCLYPAEYFIIVVYYYLKYSTSRLRFVCRFRGSLFRPLSKKQRGKYLIKLKYICQPFQPYLERDATREKKIPVQPDDMITVQQKQKPNTFVWFTLCIL